MSESLQKQRIGRILAHTAKVVEPWREMVARLKGQLFHCAKHIHAHDTSHALAITSFKMIEKARQLLADAEVT